MIRVEFDGLRGFRATDAGVLDVSLARSIGLFGSAQSGKCGLGGQPLCRNLPDALCALRKEGIPQNVPGILQLWLSTAREDL